MGWLVLGQCGDPAKEEGAGGCRVRRAEGAELGGKA